MRRTLPASLRSVPRRCSTLRQRCRVAWPPARRGEGAGSGPRARAGLGPPFSTADSSRTRGGREALAPRRAAPRKRPPPHRALPPPQRHFGFPYALCAACRGSADRCGSAGTTAVFKTEAMLNVCAALH